MDDVTKRHDALKPELPEQPQPQPAPDDEAPDYSVAEGQGAAVDEPEDLLSHVLTRPIQAHGETITTLTWREPTGGDIERAGNPIALEGLGTGMPRLTFDERKMSAMISHLAAIPPTSVRALTARDWNAIAMKVFRFFM